MILLSIIITFVSNLLLTNEASKYYFQSNLLGSPFYFNWRVNRAFCPQIALHQVFDKKSPIIY